MTRNEVRLLNVLTAAYMECLRQPHSSKFRIDHQSLYARLVEAIAALSEDVAENTQDYLEHLVALEKDEN